MYSRSYKRKKEQQVRWDIVVPIAILVVVVIAVSVVLALRSGDDEEENRREDETAVVNEGGREEEDMEEVVNEEEDEESGVVAGEDEIPEIEPGTAGYLEIGFEGMWFWPVAYRIGAGMSGISFRMGTETERNDRLVVMIGDCEAGSVIRTRTQRGSDDGVRIGEFYYYPSVVQGECPGVDSRAIQGMLRNPVRVRGAE
ncbi:hypothetical protein FWD07_01565 [Candidatus Saccharibacteria bacterium]|nr:hypothetical protein [Candidatus Saccharibacteria bacterium]